MPHLATWTFTSNGARPPIGLSWKGCSFSWEAEDFGSLSVFPTRSDTATCSNSGRSSQGSRNVAIAGSSWQAQKTIHRPKLDRLALRNKERGEALIEIGAHFTELQRGFRRYAEERLPPIKGLEPPTEIGAAFPTGSSGSTPLGTPLRSIDQKHGDKETTAPLVGLLANSVEALHIGEHAESTRALKEDKEVAVQEAATDHDVSVTPLGDAHKTSKNGLRCDLESVRLAGNSIEPHKQPQLVLPSCPAAEQPEINQYPLQPGQITDTSGIPDAYSTSWQNGGNNRARKDNHRQLEHGSVAFKYEKCTPIGLGCPLGKLGFDVDNCSSKARSGYIHWRFLRGNQHLNRHMEAGHMTSDELQQLKSLNASHGLPSPNTDVLENVAKYFRRAIVTIAIELTQFEALINPYQGWDLCDEKTLGTEYNSCKDALRQFNLRRQHETLVVGDPGLFAGSTFSDQVHNGLPSTEDLHQKAVKEFVAPRDGDHSFLAQSSSSLGDLAWGSGYSVTSADSAQLQSPDALADERTRRIHALMRATGAMNDAVEALQSVGELPDTVSFLRKNMKIASGRVITVNRQPALSRRGDTRTMTSSHYRRYRVSKQAPRSSNEPSRPRQQQQQQDTQVHRTNFNVPILSQRPNYLRATEQPFSSEESLSLPSFGAQMTIPDLPSFWDSSTATDQVSSGVSTPPMARLDGQYLPDFSVLPYSGYDLTEPSKIQDEGLGFGRSSSPQLLDLDQIPGEPMLPPDQSLEQQ